jgi:hypothetical protein
MFQVPYILVWKHMAEEPMFPNLKSINLRIKCFSQWFKKNHDESLLFRLQEDFLKFFFAINVSYHKKGEHFGS